MTVEFSAVRDRPIVEGRDKVDSAYNELNSEKPLKSKENETIIDKLTLDLQNKDSLLGQLNSEIANYKSVVSLLKLDLENTKTNESK